jgi:hypothetical protein
MNSFVCKRNLSWHVGDELWSICWQQEERRARAFNGMWSIISLISASRSFNLRFHSFRCWFDIIEITAHFLCGVFPTPYPNTSPLSCACLFHPHFCEPRHYLGQSRLLTCLCLLHPFGCSLQNPKDAVSIPPFLLQSPGALRVWCFRSGQC